MKKLLLAILLTFFFGSAHANTLCWVSSYTRADGVFVSSYIRQQTACVKSTPVMPTAENLAVLKAVAFVGGILALINLNEKSKQDEILNTNHTIFSCSWNDESFQRMSPAPTVFVTHEKAYMVQQVDNPFLKSMTNVLDKKDDDLFRKDALLGWTEFNSSTGDVTFSSKGKYSMSCRKTHEVEIRD